jgi:hypothetical protein
MCVITASNDKLGLVVGDSNNHGASVLHQVWHHAWDREVDRRVCCLRARAPIMVKMYWTKGGIMRETVRLSADYAGAKCGANRVLRQVWRQVRD